MVAMPMDARRPNEPGESLEQLEKREVKLVALLSSPEARLVYRLPEPDVHGTPMPAGA